MHFQLSKQHAFLVCFRAMKCSEEVFCGIENNSQKKSATNRTKVEEKQVFQDKEANYENFENDKKCAFQAPRSSRNIFTLDQKSLDGFNKNREIIEKTNHLSTPDFTPNLPSPPNGHAVQLIPKHTSQIDPVLNCSSNAIENEIIPDDNSKIEERLELKVEEISSPLKKVETEALESELTSNGTTPLKSLPTISTKRVSSNNFSRFGNEIS